MVDLYWDENIDPNSLNNSNKSDLNKLSFETNKENEKVFVVHRMNKEKEETPIQTPPNETFVFTPTAQGNFSKFIF